MTTINTVIFGIFAVLGIIGALIGFSKGLIRSAVKVASIVLAIVVAFSVTPSLLNTAYDLAAPQIDQFMSSFDELLTASPTLKEYLPNAISALISPMVFIVVFAVCLAVVAILRKIVMWILGALLPKKRGLISRVGGLALGAVGGIMIALCFVFPVTGYFTAVPTIYSNVKEIVSTDENPIPADVDELLLKIDTISNVQSVNNATKNYFNKLVSYTDGDKTVSALDDFATITSLVPPMLRFITSMANVETMDVDAIRDVINTMGDNTKLRTITAEVLSVASKNWKDNQSFMGVNIKESLEPEYEAALDVVLEKLSKTTEATVTDDLNSLADTIVTIQQLYSYANLLKQGATLADLNDKLEDVLAGLTEDTVDIMSSLITDEVLGEFGIDNKENATVVADLVTDVAKNLINSETSTPEDTAAAVNSIMQFVSGDSTDADKVVSDILGSAAVKDAIHDTAHVDEGETAPVIDVDDSQKSAIESALSELEDDRLKADIKALFGIDG